MPFISTLTNSAGISSLSMSQLSFGAVGRVTGAHAGGQTAAMYGLIRL